MFTIVHYILNSNTDKFVDLFEKPLFELKIADKKNLKFFVTQKSIKTILR